MTISNVLPAHEHFYEQLEGFSVFSEFSNANWYVPLAEGWCVVITDIEGSTVAIEKGRYKEVNAVGVASIVALTNAIKPLKVPYVFGGDGATFCIPGSMLSLVEPALVAAKKMSRQSFGLKLRIGIVHIAEIRHHGHDVLVAKHQPHSYFQQAMFMGEGLAYAEKLVKDPDPRNDYLISEQLCADVSIFEGYECRWNEIPSPHEENIALLVQNISDDTEKKDRIYTRLLEQVEMIYGKEAQYHPLSEEMMSLASSFRLLSVEARIRTAFQSGWKRLQYLLKLQVLRWVGNWFMSHATQTDSTNWGKYKHNLIVNTDYRKFDNLLRMVISGTAEQRHQLQSILEEYRGRGEIVFGIHASPSALITCIVANYDRDHVHFLDGASGGYAMAAQEMKRQLKNVQVCSAILPGQENDLP